MDMDKKAMALILATAVAIPMEGLRQRAYRDVTGLPTVCFGSTTGVKMGDFRTVPECKAMLTKEMQDVIARVDLCQPGLPTEVLAAFADAAYNLGSTVACDKGKSTAARFLAAGQFRAACNELPKWDRARIAGALRSLPGLTKRRKMEQELCLKGL